MRISDWSSDVCSSDLQHELGDQLRAQYASGLSPWTALLSGDNPQVVGRDLSYLGYITEEQSQAVKVVRLAIAALAALQAKTEAGQKTLTQFASATPEQTQEPEPQTVPRQQENEREKQ